jgi:acyl-CoA synthetase (AMP-forming)/AMP-acid ligase II
VSDETDDRVTVASVFADANTADAIAARLDVLNAAAAVLPAIGDQLHATGFVLRGPRRLAAALLCRLAGELCAGMSLLLQAHQAYGAASLLRQLAPYKYPRWIEFVDQLPKTGTGKLQRFKLRERALALSAD